MNFIDIPRSQYKKLFSDHIQASVVQKLKEQNKAFSSEVSIIISYVELGRTKIYYGENCTEPLIDVSTDEFSDAFYNYVKGLEGWNRLFSTVKI